LPAFRFKSNLYDSVILEPIPLKLTHIRHEPGNYNTPGR